MIELSNLNQKKWARCCTKLGLTVDKKLGKGSHYRIINPANNKKTTLPNDCHKFISLGIYKTLLQWGFTEEQIDKSLR